MNNPDGEFVNKLARIQLLHDEMGKLLQYTDHEGVPLDLNDIKNQTQIGSFENWATKLEDKALEFSEIAETIRTYPSLMEEDFLEKEMELLPDEGIRTGALIGE